MSFLHNNPKRKLSKYPLLVEWMNKLWCIVWNTTPKLKDKLMIHSTIWMNLKNFVLNKIWSQKHKYGVIQIL